MKGLKSLPLVIALILTIAVPVNAVPVPSSDTTKSGSLQEKLRKAMPETPDNTAGHVTHYVLEIIEGIEVGLTIAEKMHWVGALALPLEVAGPIAGMAAVYVALGNAHADAINSVITDQILSGFSRGVVLGADERSGDFVKSHFVKYAPVPHTVYPEYGQKFQNAYNSALVAGYAQGKALTREERKAFAQDLIARMSVHPTVTYGEDYKQWSDRTWVDYYIEAAAIFRRDHLK